MTTWKTVQFISFIQKWWVEKKYLKMIFDMIDKKMHDGFWCAILDIFPYYHEVRLDQTLWNKKKYLYIFTSPWIAKVFYKFYVFIFESKKIRNHNSCLLCKSTCMWCEFFLMLAVILILCTPLLHKQGKMWVTLFRKKAF